MNILKFVSILNIVKYILAGSSNNCDLDNGYIFCNVKNTCIQPWITTCTDFYTDCDDCLDKQKNGLNIACPLTWDENNIIFNLQQSTNSNIPPDCDIWFDGCNSCLVDENEINICTELICSENKDERCLRFNLGH